MGRVLLSTSVHHQPLEHQPEYLHQWKNKVNTLLFHSENSIVVADNTGYSWPEIADHMAFFQSRVQVISYTEYTPEIITLIESCDPEPSYWHL